MRVTIIGAGKMGRAIGMRAVAGGNEVEIIDRSPEDASAAPARWSTRPSCRWPRKSRSGRASRAR